MKGYKEQCYNEERYHIELIHKAGDFEDDMDFLTPDPKLAYKQLQVLKERYPNNKVKITQICTVTSHINITENQLEKKARQK